MKQNKQTVSGAAKTVASSIEDIYNAKVRAAQALREVGISAKEISESFNTPQKIAGLFRAATVRGI